MSPNPRQPEDNFDEAENRFDLKKLRADLEAEKHGEITPAAWRYFKGVLCGYTTEDIAEKCGIERDSVQTALYRELRDFLRQILQPRRIKRMDWSSVPKWLTEAGYRLSTHHKNPPQNIPHSGVKPEHFVGRSHELEKLHQLLQEGNRVAITAIAGMGGVGKTELTIQYALKHLNDYPGGVCWLPAKNPDMGIKIVEFARSQFDNLNPPGNWNLKTQVDFCWRRWQSGEVLVVLDDVTDYEEVEPYLPPVEPRFKVLMTTRMKRLGKSIESVLLNILDEPDALKLLISHVGEERIQQERDEAKKLCAWLEFLPLGLELVGRYLDRKPDLSLAEMLQRLEEKRLSQRSIQGVKAAFELSWETLNDEAKQLGCLLNLFAPAPISWYLVEWSAPAQDKEDLEDIRDNILINLHLLQYMDKGIYRLHRLIREFLQEKLENMANKNDIKRDFTIAISWIAGQITQSPTHQFIKAISFDVRHIEQAAIELTDFFIDEDLPQPFLGLGWFYQGQGFYDLAELWLKKSLSITQSRLSENSLEVATSYNNLALLYHAQGNYVKAKKLCIRALEIGELSQDEEAAKRASIVITLNNLAVVNLSLGEYSAVESSLEEALELTQSLMTNAESNEEKILIHDCVATIINTLGQFYCVQGDFSKSESNLDRALEISHQLWGNEHLNLVPILNNLGYLYHVQGQNDKAEYATLLALVISLRLQREDHPDVANQLNNLATLYYHQKRYIEAQSTCTKALQIVEQQLSTNHPLTVQCRDNLEAIHAALKGET
jgi:tetratricopeptide (TPR) repeat protein